mmetsp:Transcript_28024/g.44602  ORF Transcript_28024/g.44602 Transcript_28024/m.44602 type:complete len:108 (-) Transcript_28024:1118-1441(-)
MSSVSDQRIPSRENWMYEMEPESNFTSGAVGDDFLRFSVRLAFDSDNLGSVEDEGSALGRSSSEYVPGGTGWEAIDNGSGRETRRDIGLVMLLKRTSGGLASREMIT